MMRLSIPAGRTGKLVMGILAVIAELETATRLRGPHNEKRATASNAPSISVRIATCFHADFAGNESQYQYVAASCSAFAGARQASRRRRGTWQNMNHFTTRLSIRANAAAV
jgi:hypothetical protein